jgi:putative mRNA 3-end processing factor
MSAMPPPLVTVTENGLYCQAGGFHIDPWRPVETAVITHAHGDHLRQGSKRYLVTESGMAIACHRLGTDHHPTPLKYGEQLQLGATTISLHPAGHILGSAQLRIEHEGQAWVISGDYKRQPDPTCAPFEPLACDVFISEATFALPVYQWQPTAEVVEEIFHWWRANRDRGLASVLFCYALGKAQRVLAELQAFTDETVYLHGAVNILTDVYRQQGVEMLPTMPVTGERKTDYRGALVIAPPSAAGTPWMRRFGDHSSGFCSGWMRVRGNRRRRGYDRGFVLSDHVDWPGLIDTVKATGAQRILLTHGYSDALARYLNELGISAGALETAYGNEEQQ